MPCRSPFNRRGQPSRDYPPQHVDCNTSNGTEPSRGWERETTTLPGSGIDAGGNTPNIRQGESDLAATEKGAGAARSLLRASCAGRSRPPALRRGTGDCGRNGWTTAPLEIRGRKPPARPSNRLQTGQRVRTAARTWTGLRPDCGQSTPDPKNRKKDQIPA